MEMDNCRKFVCGRGSAYSSQGVLGAAMSIGWQQILITAVFLSTIIPTWIIVRRVGFSGWWALLSLVPLVNVLFFWVLALVKWPERR
jgi:uncharacterized membrane protein YhaH (DUF805 family)